MITLLWRLYFAFAKVGLLSLGGGLAIIAVLQQELISRSWLTQNEFLDILAIAQITPGPIGVNAATFCGWRVAANTGGGVLACIVAALAATAAFMTASVIGVAALGTWFERNRDRPWMKRVFAILRPMVSAVIFAVGVDLVLSLFGTGGESGTKCIRDLGSLTLRPMPLVLCMGTFILTITKRFSPLWGLLAAALLGLFW